MEVVLVIVLFLSLAAALFAFAVALSMPKSEMAARLSTLLSEKSEPQATPAIQQRLEEAAERLGQIAPKSPAQLSNTRALLLNAGLREPRHMTYYFAARIAFAGLTLLAIVLTGLVFRQPVLLAAVAIAYSVPRVFLKRAARKRQHAIQMGLPDALDLAVICVESGIGLDGAIRRVADELGDVHTELSEEFLLVNFEIRAGTPRPDALRNLGERTGVDDIKSLSAVLIQTDRFGTSVATALRVQSDALRTERRQRAEERAAKTTIKMVPALVFFIFPAMFCVTLGPAVIALIRNLLPAIQR